MVLLESGSKEDLNNYYMQVANWNDGTFEFLNVLEGDYEVSIVNHSFCWEK